MSAARTRTTRALVAVGLTLALAGCGREVADSSAYPPNDGANSWDGTIAVRNVVVVTDGDRTAGVLGALVNRGAEDDRLAEVRIAGVSASLWPRRIDLPGHSSVTLGREPSAVISTTPNIVPGRFVTVMFRFGAAETVTVRAVVRDDDGFYEGLAPTPLPTPTPTPVPLPTASPTDPATPEPTPAGSPSG